MLKNQVHLIAVFMSGEKDSETISQWCDPVCQGLQHATFMTIPFSDHRKHYPVWVQCVPTTKRTLITSRITKKSQYPQSYNPLL